MMRPNSPTAHRITEDGGTTRMLHSEHLFGLANADRLTGPAKARFRELLPPIYLRFDIGGIGVAAVNPSPADTYELAEVGPKALIFPCRGYPGTHPEPLIDLVAWNPRTGELYRRLGIADLLGGWHVMPPASDVVKVYSDPASWARAGGDGVVVLDWGRVHFALGHVRKLVADDVALGRRLRDAMTPPAPRLPRILVETSKHEVAA